MISTDGGWGRAALPLWAAASEEHEEKRCNGSHSLLKCAGAKSAQEFTDAFSERFHPCAAPTWRAPPL